MAKVGATATPNTDAAAAEMKAVREISAFKAVALGALPAGANADEHTAKVERRRTWSFMLLKNGSLR